MCLGEGFPINCADWMELTIIFSCSEHWLDETSIIMGQPLRQERSSGHMIIVKITAMFPSDDVACGLKETFFIKLF